MTYLFFLSPNRGPYVFHRSAFSMHKTQREGNMACMYL